MVRAVSQIINLDLSQTLKVVISHFEVERKIKIVMLLESLCKNPGRKSNLFSLSLMWVYNI